MQTELRSLSPIPQCAPNSDSRFSQMGWLLSAFAWSYAFAQLPMGAAIDRYGPRHLFGWGLIVWSLAQAAGGVVHSYAQFLVARIILGVGEAPQFPSAAKVVSDWFPAERTRRAHRNFHLFVPSWFSARTSAPHTFDDRVRLALDLSSFPDWQGLSSQSPGSPFIDRQLRIH